MFVFRKTMLRAVAQLEKELRRARHQLGQEREKYEKLEGKMQAIVGDVDVTYNFGAGDLKPGMAVEVVSADTRFLVEHNGRYALLYASSDYENPKEKPELHTTQMGWVDSLEKVAKYMREKFYRIKLKNGAEIHRGD